MQRMSAGREFQTDGPATENARSPNLVTVGGTVYDNVSVEERSPCRRDDAPVVCSSHYLIEGITHVQ